MESEIRNGAATTNPTIPEIVSAALMSDFSSSIKSKAAKQSEVRPVVKNELITLLRRVAHGAVWIRTIGIGIDAGFDHGAEMRDQALHGPCGGIT